MTEIGVVIYSILYHRVIERLTADVKRPFRLDDNLTCVDDTQIHKGLRECLANALIHADYYGRRGIVIDKEFRKVTISNPGTFRIDIDEAIAGGISDARNSKIFNMFSLINVGERSGIGLCDVYSAWKSCGYKQPEFKESVDSDRITLTLNIEVEANEKSNVANVVNDVTNGVADVVNVAIDYELTYLDKAIYRLITVNTNASTKEIAEAVKVTVHSVQRSANKLEKLQIIKKRAHEIKLSGLY